MEIQADAGDDQEGYLPGYRAGWRIITDQKRMERKLVPARTTLFGRSEVDPWRPATCSSDQGLTYTRLSG